jgi:hypothetical protein
MAILESTPTTEEVVRFMIETNGYITMEPRGGLGTVHSRIRGKGADQLPVPRTVIEKMDEGKLLTGKLLGSAVYYELTDLGRMVVTVSSGR